MDIYGKKVILRGIEKKDLPLICRMFNDPEIEDKVIGWSFPLSSYQQERWYEKNIDDKNSLRFVIETREGEAIGIVSLINIDWKNRNAGHGLKLEAAENRGKGFGTDALMAILRYAFDELQLNRVDVSYFEHNIASINMHKKCGFQEEGRKRNYVYKRGEYRDVIFGGILKEEYQALVKKNNYWG